MAELKLVFDAVKRGPKWFVLSAFSAGKPACRLSVRLVHETAVLLPYPRAPFEARKEFRGKGVGAALVAYAVGFARRQGVRRVVFANFADEKLAKKLAGPGRVELYCEFNYPQGPERFQIVWD